VRAQARLLERWGQGASARARPRQHSVVRLKKGMNQMKSEPLRILKGSVDMSEGRRGVLRLLGGGGALLLASGCAFDATDADTEKVGSIEQRAVTPQGINLCYVAVFDRPASDAEINYWGGRQPSMSFMYNYLRTWMRSSNGTGDRLAVIRYAYQTVYRRLYTANEFNYWNNYLSNNDAAFCDVCKWLESYGRDNRYTQTGWFTIKHGVDSTWQADLSIENYSGKTYNV
jgi:hypothetical protein